MSGARVLVVEDDPSIRGLLQTLLETEGFEVATAPDGVSGLAKVASLEPHVVLLDLNMPDLSGDRVLERMRADPALADVPVVVVTGEEVSDTLGVRTLVGDRNVFGKPFDVEDLLARVRDLARGRG